MSSLTDSSSFTDGFELSSFSFFLLSSVSNKSSSFILSELLLTDYLLEDIECLFVDLLLSFFET